MLNPHSPAHAPVDASVLRGARTSARAAATRRLAATTIIVSVAVVIAVTTAYRQAQAAERWYSDIDAPRTPARQSFLGPRLGPRAPVSRYALSAVADDRVHATFWRGTGLEYTVVARADSRDEQPVRDAPPAWRGVETVNWREGLNGLVEIEALGTWRFSTFHERCADNEQMMDQWLLCPLDTEAPCITAPTPTSCWQGPLRLVDLYATKGALWAVVEREMDNRTSRMVAGTKLR